MTEPITGTVTETADLDDERLSQALARATFDLLDEIAAKGGKLMIRHEPDDADEGFSMVSVRVESIGAVKVTAYDDEPDSDEVPDEDPIPPSTFPFGDDDQRFILEALDQLPEGD